MAQVGATGFSTNPPGGLTLAFSKGNLPLLSTETSGPSLPSSWPSTETRGLRPRIPPRCWRAPLRAACPWAYRRENLIYTAFPDRSYQYKATVVSSSGSGWTHVGQAGFSESGIQAICLRVDAKGVL